MNFLDLSKKRYSCRQLTDTPIPAEQIEALLVAATAAPTAKNNQPYRIWVMQSEAAQAQIHEVTKCTFGAGLFFVVGGKPSDAWTKEDGFNFAQVDATIVATHLMLAVASAGLGTTWVGNFDAPKLKTLCPEMAEYELVAIFPVGVPAKDAVPSPRHSERKAREAVVKIL
ncbi:nitroreductase family protein [Pseudoramibacter sp. HA2172]|uniref:nitroreductase family protein n=1 Tax=Pseudoramibacter faecis TaxID=3108534 RepID=UPI002E781044|nr:nitroreductase family protein [Pseudoramibacter sp. HA2172]